MYCLSIAGFIACKDASLFDASSCPSTPSSTFYKLLYIERSSLLAVPQRLYTGRREPMRQAARRTAKRPFQLSGRFR